MPAGLREGADRDLHPRAGHGTAGDPVANARVGAAGVAHMGDAHLEQPPRIGSKLERPPGHRHLEVSQRIVGKAGEMCVAVEQAGHHPRSRELVDIDQVRHRQIATDPLDHPATDRNVDRPVELPIEVHGKDPAQADIHGPIVPCLRGQSL